MLSPLLVVTQRANGTQKELFERATVRDHHVESRPTGVNASGNIGSLLFILHFDEQMAWFIIDLSHRQRERAQMMQQFVAHAIYMQFYREWLIKKRLGRPYFQELAPIDNRHPITDRLDVNKLVRIQENAGPFRFETEQDIAHITLTHRI